MRKDASGGFPVGDHILGKRIGTGAFATVRIARHASRLDDISAAKVFVKASQSAEDTVDMEREIEYGKILSHKNVVQLRDVYEDQTYRVLFLEYAPGKLEDLLGCGIEVPELKARVMFHDVLSAVAHCHQHGIAHLDIKAANILTGADGEMKLADFGLARRQPADGEECVPITHGSPAYAAPEVYDGTACNYLAVDMWACGVLLFYILTGWYPFSELSPLSLPPDKPPPESAFAAPAAGRCPRRLTHRIRYGDFSTDTISTEAAALVRRLLQRDTTLRATAAQALDDPWVSTTGTLRSRATVFARKLSFQLKQTLGKKRRQDSPPHSPLAAPVGSA